MGSPIGVRVILRWATSPGHFESAPQHHGDRFEQFITIEFIHAAALTLDFHRCIEPAEERLALAIAVVVNVEETTGISSRRPGPPRPMPRSPSRRGPRLRKSWPREIHDRAPRRVGPFGVIEKVEFVGDDDELSLFELFAVNVENVFRELAPFDEAKDLSGAHGIDENTERSHRVVIAVDLLKWKAHGCDEMTYNSRPAREKDIGTGGGRQGSGGIDQGVEAAAKAAAGDFLDREMVEILQIADRRDRHPGHW